MTNILEKPPLHTLDSCYIVKLLKEASKNGHAYLPQDALWEQVHSQHSTIPYTTFMNHRSELLAYEYLALEGQRYYLPQTLEYENAAAELLSTLLPCNHLKPTPLPETITVHNTALTADQREAVSSALSHRISLVLGGAGTGKTTLIQGILKHCQCRYILCAPTGKAAVNLTEKVGKFARTVHSALGKVPDQNFLSPVQWSEIDLIVVDEASMVTLEMLAGLLSVMGPFCQLVLVGDPQQLLSVGAGNVIPDLLELGVPSYTLQVCHRQSFMAKALSHNVKNFKDIHDISQLQFDDSFQLVEGFSDAVIAKVLCKEGASGYLQGKDIQVLSPFNSLSQLSVNNLNKTLQPMVNKNPPVKNCPFRENDRIMITNNDWSRWIFNGEIGYLHLKDKPEPTHHLLKNGEVVTTWDNFPTKYSDMTLAYAITVHKSQASEWGTILLPLNRLSPIFTRNLIYTAISRGKNKVILYGRADVLQHALRTNPSSRNSKLVVKTKQFTKFHVA